jgi:hypothetical protein
MLREVFRSKLYKLCFIVINYTIHIILIEKYTSLKYYYSYRNFNT